MEAGVQPLKLAQKCPCGLVGKCSWLAERLSVPTPPRHLPTPELGFSNTVIGVMRGTAKGCELVTAKSLPFSCWPKRKKKQPCSWELFHGSQPCCSKGACKNQWNYEPCSARPPKTDRPKQRVLTKHGPLEEEMATHSSILATRTPWTVWKGKKHDTER